MQLHEKILVVDDDHFNLTLMRELCESSGYRVVDAKDGEEALKRTEEERPDLLLLDVMMPKLDGFQVCAQLRRNPATRDIPVILVTAMNDMDSKIRGMELGADDYVTKPFKLFELQTRIRAALTLRRYRIQLADAERRLAELHLVDEESGIGNAEQLQLTLDREYTRAERYGHPLACATLAVEDFAAHRAKLPKEEGGAFLDAIVQRLKGSIRVVDLICRTKENVFGLIMPETQQAGAFAMAERIVRGLRENPVVWHGEPLPLVLTIGVAALPNPNVKQAGDLARLADEAREKAGAAGQRVGRA